MDRRRVTQQAGQRQDSEIGLVTMSLTVLVFYRIKVFSTCTAKLPIDRLAQTVKVKIPANHLFMLEEIRLL